MLLNICICTASLRWSLVVDLCGQLAQALLGKSP